MIKETVGQPYHGILHSNEKKQTTDVCNNLDRSRGHYAEWKKPISKSHIIYDSIFRISSKWKNYRDGEQSNGGQGLGVVRGKGMGVTIKVRQQGADLCVMY